jgi:hypothetical protein
MAFKYYSSVYHALPPFEFKAAAAGTYELGQAVAVNSAGLIAPLTAALTTAPAYICMHRGTVAAGDLIPTARGVPEAVYETELTANFSALVVGSALEISASGLGVDGTAAGAFIVTEFEGKSAGSWVRGYFSFIGAEGPPGPGEDGGADAGGEDGNAPDDEVTEDAKEGGI